jgi:hypothetical protein
MYAMTQTRPDIAFAVSLLSRFAHNPSQTHIKAAKRVIRYLKTTRTIGITYEGSKHGFYGYSDADWGGNIDTRQSTSGYVFFLFGGAISWRTTRQRVVALSSTESEYYGLTNAAREAKWLRSLLTELQYNGEDVLPTLIKGDNQGSLALSENPEHHQRTKHIDIQHHYIRNEVLNGNVALEYVPTANMAADGLTKPLSAQKHANFMDMLGMEEWS